MATIGNDAVTTAKINNGAVTNDKLASGIQVQKINFGSGNLQPSYIDLTAGNILVGDASGNAASVTLTGDLTIANNGVATIANGAITSAKINDGAITNDKVASGIQVQKVNFGSGNITPDVLDLASAKILVGNAVETRQLSL